MRGQSGTRAMTVRLSPEMHREAAEAARRRGTTLSALIRQSLAATIEADDYQARYDGYTLLGQDMEECNVDYARHAQAEVVLMYGDDDLIDPWSAGGQADA